MDLIETETLIQAIQSRNHDKARSVLTRSIAAGFNVNQPLLDPDNGKTLAWAPLFWVVSSGDEEMLLYFLDELKANPNVIDADGQNPAHLAVRVIDRSQMLRPLLRHGCDACALDGFGMTIIDIAKLGFGIGSRRPQERVRIAIEVFNLAKAYRILVLLFVRDKAKTRRISALSTNLLREINTYQ